MNGERPIQYTIGVCMVLVVLVVPQNPGTLLLEFPSGVLIDLTPLMS